MLDARIVCGLEAFNAGEYFKAHDIWEAVWREVQSPEKEYYQALIQAAVALHHWRSGNVVGAHRLARRALKRLEEFAPLHLGLDTRQVRQVLYQLLSENVARTDEKPTRNGIISNQQATPANCLIIYSESSELGRDKDDREQE